MHHISRRGVLEHPFAQEKDNDKNEDNGAGDELALEDIECNGIEVNIEAGEDGGAESGQWERTDSCPRR